MSPTIAVPGDRMLTLVPLLAGNAGLLFLNMSAVQFVSVPN